MNYPPAPNSKNEYCRFAAEWIRAFAEEWNRLQGNHPPSARVAAFADAARAFRRAHPAIAREVHERIGDWPSAEPEFRALQNT